MAWHIASTIAVIQGSSNSTWVSAGDPTKFSGQAQSGSFCSPGAQVATYGFGFNSDVATVTENGNGTITFNITGVTCNRFFNTPAGGTHPCDFSSVVTIYDVNGAVLWSGTKATNVAVDTNINDTPQSFTATIPAQTNAAFNVVRVLSDAPVADDEYWLRFTFFNDNPPDYRPGQRKVSGTWSSHDRSSGAANRKVSGTATTMRTWSGGVGTDDPPKKKKSGTWYNQNRVGGS